MRVAAWLVLAAVLSAPLAEASRTEGTWYASPGGNSARFIQAANIVQVGVNGAAFFPRAGDVSVNVTVVDVTGVAVPLKICHEVTYNHAQQHPTTTCGVVACGAITNENLTWPADPDTVYRLLVFVYPAPGACARGALAGRVLAEFS